MKNVEKMLDLMEDNEDIQNVWHNWEVRSDMAYFKLKWSQADIVQNYSDRYWQLL